MATTANSSQMDAVRTLLIERLELFDPGMDVSEGSSVWTQVVQPVLERLGTDPFDTDTATFLRDRLRQEYPSLSVGRMDAITDLLVRPVQVLIESFKREIQIIRQGQSVVNAASMRREDAEALAANWFTAPKTGGRSFGTARLYFSAPTYVAVLATSSAYTSGGLRYFPTVPQFFSSSTVLLQRSGTEYYVDVTLIAENTGEEYNIAPGEIVRAAGIGSVTRIANLYAFSGGEAQETPAGLLTRVRTSLAERSLNVSRGISARLQTDFPSVRNLEVVGYGDPEMNRDVITGTSEGHVRASGTCFIVGQFCLLFSQYEDRGRSGTEKIVEGDEIELNYWKFLYDVEAEESHETFTVEDIVFDSRDVIANLPSILLFRMSGAPSIAGPIAGTLPGVLPAVFAVVRTAGKITISDIPGGVLFPETDRGTVEIEDGAIHIGGHYDIWVRPTADAETSIDISNTQSETSLLDATDLICNGEEDGLKNQVHRPYIVSYDTSIGAFIVDEVVTFTFGSVIVTGKIYKKLEVGSVYQMYLRALTGEIQFSEDTVTSMVGGTSGATGTVTAVDGFNWSAIGLEDGMLIAITAGSDEGVYHVLSVDGPFAYLHLDLTTSEELLHFRALSEINVDLFEPKAVRIPFGVETGSDLRTTIGLTTVRVGVDLLQYGVSIGDTLEILEGDDKGTYTITGFDSSPIGSGPVLSATMTATNSSVPYTVYQASSGVLRPFVRIQPGGVSLLNSAGQTTGYSVPYALPVDGRAHGAFSGSKATATGKNGFVLIDPGVDWTPTADVTCSEDEFEDSIACFSDDCLACDGYIACVTLTDSGDFYLNSGLPAAATDFLQKLQEWFSSVVDNFDLGEDARVFVEGFHPVILGAPTSGTPIMAQFEICIPREVFDGCNNVFVALPEFDWEVEFASVDSLAAALEKYTSGTMRGDAPGLASAVEGDSLTLLSGANAGSYIIHKVFDYRLCTSGAIIGDSVDISDCYQVVAVVIDGEFPVPPMGGIVKFFESNGIPELSDFPVPPAFPGTSVDVDGNFQSPWEWVGLFLDWILKTLVSLGFDMPSSVDLDPEETLKAIWQLLFTEYVIGKTTCEQTTRLYFVEPTSFTAVGLLPCTSYTWAETQTTGAVLRSWHQASNFTLPLLDLEGVEFSLRVKDIAEDITLTGSLSWVDGAEPTTIEALAALLQTALDASGRYVTFSGPATATGALTITSVEGGIDVALYAWATDVEDGFRACGFHDATGEVWATVDSLVGNPDFSISAMYLSGSVEFTPYVAPQENYGFNFSIFTGTPGVEVSPGDRRLALTNIVEAGTYTYEEIRAEMETQILAKMILVGVVDATAVITFDDDVLGGSTVTERYYKYTLTISGEYDGNPLTAWFIDGGTDSTLQDLDEVGLNLVGTNDPDGVLSFQFPAVPTRFYLWNLSVDVSGTVYSTDFTYIEAISFNDGVDAYNAGDADLLAQGLNAHAGVYTDGVTRILWFVGGSILSIRTVSGGVSTTLTPSPDATAAYFLGYLGALGFTAEAETTGSGDTTNNSDVGTSVVGTSHSEVFGAPAPTLFSVVAASAELLFVADGDQDPWQSFPPQTSAGAVDVFSLPRDIEVSTAYDGMLSSTLRFTDTEYPAPLAAGLKAGWDWLWLYEQRTVLENQLDDIDIDSEKDRLIAVKTMVGSSIIELPVMADSDQGTFLHSQAGNEDDEVRVGDLVFIEEGDDLGGYVVIARAERSLTLNAAMTASSGRVYRAGGDGLLVADAATITSDTALFTETDVGRYVSIWGSNRVGVDGSYTITSVTSDGGTTTTATLDTEVFERGEEFLHWALVKAPTSSPGDSGTEGRNALSGVVPIRIYNGLPSKWRVAKVGTTLTRVDAEVMVALEGDTEGPRKGVLQPYQFIRPGVQRVATLQMSSNRENGLFYADIVTKSLGGDTLYNIPEQTRMEPVFGTYKSDGYRLETSDTRTVFSSEEETSLVLTPTFLPSGVEDTLDNILLLESRMLRIEYDYAPLVSQIQELVTSRRERVLCASPLTRHFLPSYVYLNINYEGGDLPTFVAADIAAYINALQPTDFLDLSEIEGILHRHGVTRYAHPITLILVTHDLDRRLVGSQSQSRIGEQDVDFNGSNRTTFFIPGADQSTQTTESKTTVGERIYLTRTVRSPVIR